ncbi:MAG: hypothetical protein M1827_000549 [Pycnora praestabilis]|nr:MAG: hypothetical protein M1827_000549 [Pycnora praestabilis]
MDCMRNNFHEGILLDGRFESISPLNHGSFGMVFMAKDATTGEFVALKCLTKSSPSSICPSALAIDERSEELACHARLGFHPNIVNLIHSFETDAHLYLVLEFCAMGDLYEAIRHDRGPLETENVRDFMLQLLDAVEHMHGKGLYHRDIKPENIFLTQSGDMKLGDFGLATTEFWTDEPSVGSDRYMAPEQYDPAGMGYSPAQADIWAIGICLLNILFSRNPFVTPSESDLLFADYIRDRQSLFDIFPNMSQDTFEVLVHAMALDPKKRSLTAVRQAINRVVSFTTDDEQLDDFCAEDHEVVPASANREPLRTPSVQSPQISQGGSFPWAKALQMSPPQQVRQLSAIPDTESYGEDLFPSSEKDTKEWYSAVPDTSSLASVLDSGLGASFKSMAIRRPERRRLAPSGPVPLSGSLPVPVSKPLPTMSMVFGKKDDKIAKSWSDLWDEDEEEDHELVEALQQRRAHNGRTWSQESKDDENVVPRGGLAELQNPSTVNTRTRSPASGHKSAFGIGFDGVSENDGFFFEDQQSLSRVPPRYSPPSKRSIADKWAALGDRRRAYHDTKPSASHTTKLSAVGKWRRDVGMNSTEYDGGVWDWKDKANTSKDWRHTHHQRGDGNDDLEWVGGWHDLHL